jgi:hypothetical protein
VSARIDTATTCQKKQSPRIDTSTGGGQRRLRELSLIRGRGREEQPAAHFCDVDMNLHDERHGVKILFLGISP